MSEDTITINRRQLAAYMSMTRSALSRTLGQSTAFEGDRKYYDVLGYSANIPIDRYVQRYERQDLAGRIVDLPAMDTWKHPPLVGEAGKDDTPFAKDWLELLERLRLWSVLSRADRLSGIGRFGLILLGLRDGGTLESPARRSTKANPKMLVYARPFSEESVTIETLEEDAKNERYGLPTVYLLKLKDTSVKVHWTRCFHLADGKLTSEVYGTPRLQRVFNRLDDLLKLVGGSAEATWLGMRPGTIFRPQEGFDVDDISSSDLKDEIDNYVHDPMRMMWLTGIEAQQLGPSEVINIEAPFRSIMALIAAATGIPQRVLVGSAQGQLAAASEDSRQWAGVIAERQSSYAEPEVLRPFIDHLVWLGILSAPGADGFTVGTEDDNGEWSWPPLVEMSELEQADIASKRATAVATVPRSDGSYAVTDGELRMLLGYAETGGPPPVEAPAPDEGSADVSSVAAKGTKEEKEEEGPPGAKGTPPTGNRLAANAINEAISNYHLGYLTADELAHFASSVLVAEVDHPDPFECDEPTSLLGRLVALAKKGPGRGWWGPAKGGTHGKTGTSAGASGPVDFGDVDIEYVKRLWNPAAKEMKKEAAELFPSPDRSIGEVRAIDNYTKHGFRTINPELRSGEMSTKTRREVKKLDKLIAKQPPTERDVYVYRGRPSGHSGDIHDEAYMSTSLSAQVASSFGSGEFGEQDLGKVARIRVPAGSRVLYARPSELAEQKQFEVILPRGATLKDMGGGNYDYVTEPTSNALDLVGRLVALAKKGPGRGWWGPAKGGTHGKTGSGSGIVAADMIRKIDNRDEVDAAVSDRLQEYAEKEGIASEQLEAEISEAVERAISENPIAIRVPSENLSSIVSDGRLKNQHEAGASEGFFNPKWRREAETNAFNIDKDDTNPQSYPIYGYVDLPSTWATESYGDVSLILKDSVKDRATFTVNDSINNFTNGKVIPSAMRSPERTAWDEQLRSLTAFRNKPTGESIEYFETQIHGGVSLSDIASIRVFAKLPGDYAERLSGEVASTFDKLGVSVEYVENVYE